MQVHGALVRVLGVGVLLEGPSGVGKSEIALELVTRGHQLVADDVVLIERGPDGHPEGSCPELIRHHVEIRGIGILDLVDLFGKEAVVERARIDLLCRLEQWRPGASYERVGLERPRRELLDDSLPALVLPVRPHMATLVEVAVREHLRRDATGSAAARLDARLRGEAAP